MLGKVIKSCFATKPYVWVNKDTKAICQGMTGKEVPLLFYTLINISLKGHIPNNYGFEIRNLNGWRSKL